MHFLVFASCEADAFEDARVVGAGAASASNIKVGFDGGVVDERVVLEEVAEFVAAESASSAGAEPGQVGVVEQDVAAARPFEEADAVEQRGFS